MVTELIHYRTVSTDDDVLERMRLHPIGWRYNELARLLSRTGFRMTGGKGSHRRWNHDSGAVLTLVDGPGAVKPVYVREMLAAIALTRKAP
jgi:predicted RNA binding protein YcfA (HicA-like mRNA interferase family)